MIRICEKLSFSEIGPGTFTRHFYSPDYKISTVRFRWNVSKNYLIEEISWVVDVLSKMKTPLFSATCLRASQFLFKEDYLWFTSLSSRGTFFSLEVPIDVYLFTRSTWLQCPGLREKRWLDFSHYKDEDFDLSGSSRVTLKHRGLHSVSTKDTASQGFRRTIETLWTDKFLSHDFRDQSI